LSRELVPGDVAVEDGRVVDVGLPGGRWTDRIPGLVDIQINGYGGVDFLSALTRTTGLQERRFFSPESRLNQPTFITSAEATTIEALRALPAGGVGPRVIAHTSKGRSFRRAAGHAPGRAPCVRQMSNCSTAPRRGPVTEMTLAPELPGADALVRRLPSGCVVSAGHTNATRGGGQSRFRSRHRRLTHVFNAMRPLRSRTPVWPAQALTRPDVVVKMIVDGTTSPAKLCNWSGRAPPAAVALITDAMAAAVAGGGTFHFARPRSSLRRGQPDARTGRLLARANMIDAVRNLHALGVSVRAGRCAARRFRRAFSDATTSACSSGGPADIVVLDDRLEIQTVLCAGTDNVVVRD